MGGAGGGGGGGGTPIFEKYGAPEEGEVLVI